MRIVDRKEFLSIEKPILYRVVSADFYKEDYGYLPLGEPLIKYENLSNDWFYYDLMEDIKIKDESDIADSEERIIVMDKIKSDNPELELAGFASRDGLYDEDKYLIFENDDIKTIIERLEELIK